MTANLSQVATFPGASSVATSLAYGVIDTLQTGTGTNQVNIGWFSQRSLLGSADETLDLRSLVDAFGNSITLTTLKVLLLIADAANADVIQVGGAGVNAWFGPLDANSSYMALAPGGRIGLEAPAGGYTVDVSHHLLKITNAASSPVNYAIALLGVQ